MITIFQGETGGYISMISSSDMCRLVDDAHHTHVVPALLSSGTITIQKRYLSVYPVGAYSLVIGNTTYDLHVIKRH